MVSLKRLDKGKSTLKTDPQGLRALVARPANA